MEEEEITIDDVFNNNLSTQTGVDSFIDSLGAAIKTTKEVEEEEEDQAAQIEGADPVDAAAATKPENASEGIFSASIYGNGQSQYQEGSFSEEKPEDKYKPGDFDEVFKNVFGMSIEESNIKEKKYKQEQVNKILNKYKPNTPERAYAYYKLQLKPDDTIDVKIFDSFENEKDLTAYYLKKSKEDREQEQNIVKVEPLDDSTKELEIFDLYKKAVRPSSEDLLKIQNEVSLIDLNPSIETKTIGDKFGKQTFEVKNFPFEKERKKAEELLKKEGKKFDEKSIQDRTRLLIIDNKRTKLKRDRTKDYLKNLSEDKKNLLFSDINKERLKLDYVNFMDEAEIINTMVDQLEDEDTALNKNIASIVNALEDPEFEFDLTYAKENNIPILTLKDGRKISANIIDRYKDLIETKVQAAVDIKNQANKLIKDQEEYKELYSDLDLVRRNYSLSEKVGQSASNSIVSDLVLGTELSVIDLLLFVGEGDGYDSKVEIDLKKRKEKLNSVRNRLQKDFANDFSYSPIFGEDAFESPEKFGEFFAVNMAGQAGTLMALSMGRPGLYGFAASTYGRSISDLEIANEEQGTYIGNIEKRITALGYSSAEVLLGTIPTYRLLGRAKDAFSKNDNFIKGIDDYFFKNWDVLPSSALIEGGSEAATGIAINGIDIIRGKKNISQIYEGVDEQFVVGGMFGPTISAAPFMKGLVLSSMSDYSTLSTWRSNEEAIKILNNEADGIDKRTKEYKSRIALINDLTQSNSDILDNALNDINNNLTKDGFNRYKYLTSQQETLRILANNIENNKSLSSGEKAQKLDVLNSQFDIIQSQREIYKKDFTNVFNIESKGVQNFWKQKAKQELGGEGSKETIKKKATELYRKDKIKKSNDSAIKVVDILGKAGVNISYAYETDNKTLLEKVKIILDTRLEEKSITQEYYDESLKEITEGINNGEINGANVQYVKNGKTGYDIFVSETNALKNTKTETGVHEIGHTIFIEGLKQNPEAYYEFSKNVLTYLKENNTAAYNRITTATEGQTDDEVLMNFLEEVSSGRLELEANNKSKGFLASIGLDLGKIFSKSSNTDNTYYFKNSQDVNQFLITLGNKIKNGTLTISDIKDIQEKGIAGKKGKEIELPKVSLSQTASNKVQEIYDAKGKDGAFEIIQQYEGMANKIANKYQDVPGFDRQLLVDEILTGKRGVIDMINEYDPSTKVPVAAYINKYLRSRSIEAANRILKQEFETDVTEARGVIAEETKQPKTVVSKKVKKPSETITFDKATESRIDEAVSKNFKGDEVKFSDTRNVPKDVASIYGEKLGLNPQTITDKTRNYSKKDAEGLTRAKQFLLKNAKDDYARLPKLKDDFGKGTFVPKNVKDALYTDGKLTGSLKDYIDLIREKPIKPIYRDRVGQTIRGLLNLAIRNRMLETAQPSQAKRLQSGALFSKTITPKQNTQLIEISQLGGIDNLANYLKEKGLLKGDITATKSNRKARQASILESVKNGKIPFKLIKLLKLNNFGRETVYGNETKKYDSRAKAENAGITDVKKYFTTTSGEFIEANGKKPSANTRTDWNPSRGSLYYGATDPAYNDMITAAKANDNLYSNSAFEKVKRIVIPRNKKLTRKDKKANKVQEEINQKALADFVKILDKRDGVEFLENGKPNPNYGKLIIPLNDSALFISQAYQGTTGLIKISAPFVGVSNVFVKAPKGTKQAKRDLDYIEEHSPPASKVGLSIIYGLATNTVAPIMKGVKDNFVQIQLSNSSDVLLDIAKLDKRFADGTSIVTPNAGFLRLAAAGINLNTIEDLNTGSDIATTIGYPLKGKFKKDPSAVNIQNKLMLEQATNPDIKFSKSVGRLDTYVKSLGEGVIQASNKNSGTFGDKVNTDMSMESQVKTLGDYDKTLKFSRSLNTKPKGISVFDFDDTLAKTKEKVIVNKADGTTIEISAAKFAEQASELQEAGATFDFTNFENVGKGTQKGPLADLALRRQGKFGSKDIFVLTARPQVAATDIKMFLDGIGLNLPLKNITGLEDGSPQAKANWVISKTAEGYNDFYFADDAIKNVKAVKEILDQVDVKSKVQQAKYSKSVTFDKVMNNILEDSTGIKSEAEFSRARAQTVGAKKGKFTFFTTPSAEDFVGLIYKFLGKGKVGDAQFKFFQDNLIDPYNRAEQAVTRAKISAANDFKALKNSLKTLPKSLSKKTGIGGFTFGQAARVAAWTRQGMEVPGLSKRDAKELNAFIDNNAELDVFVDELINIQKGKPYPKPSQTWLAGNITSDIVNEINKVNRKEYMQEFNENLDIIFSDKVMNKLEAAYGPKYVEALRDIIRRMKSGSNRPVGNSRIVDGLLNWLNNSVGAIMFLNTRSAVLQTISAVNFINFGNNNLIAAGKAFANQKQYWKDFMTLFNSPYLVERRDGLKINVSESEIADAVSESSNKPKAFLNLLLSKGFVLTRFADSFAIAAGGSTFYRNQVKAYVKSGMDQAAAEKQAFDDFYAIAETSQQSSNPSKISQQQASGAGRVILAFANTPMQYARIIKRASQDLIAGRGDWKTNVSKIVYYAAMQNLIFNALSNALFALAFDEEDEEKEDKTGRIANGMADSLLRGLGIRGAAVAAVKDALITIYEEENKEKGTPEFRKSITDLFGFSPPLDSKIRKLTSGLNTLSWEREKMNQEGFNLNNPAYLAFAQVIAGLTNVPLDRAIQKINNLRAATSDSSAKWQKVALLMGWSAWDLGLPYYGVEDKVEMTPKMILKEKVIVMKKETNTKQQKEMLLKLGLTKQQIKDLKYEEARVKKIIELQKKKNDSKN